MNPWEFLAWTAVICLATAMVVGTAGSVAWFMTWIEHRAEMRGREGGGR